MRFSSTRKDFTFVFVNESPYPQHGVSVTDVPPQPLECSSAHSSKSGFSGLTRPWHRNCAKLLGALPGRVAFYTLPAFPGECLGPEYNCRNCRTPTCSCQCPRSHGGCLQPLQLRDKRNLRLSVNVRMANAYTWQIYLFSFKFVNHILNYIKIKRRAKARRQLLFHHVFTLFIPVFWFFYPSVFTCNLSNRMLASSYNFANFFGVHPLQII